MKSVRIEVSAWEVDKEKFDIFLVREDEIRGDYFRDEGVMASRKGKHSVKFQHEFSLDCRACVVLSNTKAFRRSKKIHLRITQLPPSQVVVLAMGDETKRRWGPIAWRLLLGSILLLPALLAIVDLSLTGGVIGIAIAGLVYTIIGIYARFYTPEVRRILELKD